MRLMADFAATGVWDRGGYPGDFEALPISDQLRQNIQQWADWYDNECDHGMPNPRQFPYAEFAAAGLALAKRLKAELPSDWTVIYHDEEKSLVSAEQRTGSGSYKVTDEQRAFFEYEITVADQV